jgi:hypothetical protein
MDSAHAIDVDNDSELTPLYSADTPPLEDGEHPPIRALAVAQQAHDDAEFDLVVARMPSDHRLRVNGINYVKYDPYRPRKSRRTVWYWLPDQATELIRTTKGIYQKPPSLLPDYN